MIRRLKALLARDKRSSVEILHTEVLNNPFYPFQLGLSLEDKTRVFTLRVPYRRKRISFFFGIACFAMMISMLATNNINSSIFVYVTVVFIQSAAIYVNYRHERIYLLDEENKTYSFIVGPYSVTSDYHNLYIRLNRKMQVGVNQNDIARYDLVLDGVKIDQRKLTKRPSSDVRALRKLGQKIARNLNINYFDQANVSVFHNVRHQPENH